MAHLGLPPDYFRIELGVTKLIGAVLIWIPILLLKEIAYIGFAIMFGSASLAHYAVGDPILQVVAGLVFLVVLIVFYITNDRIQNFNTVNTKKQ